MATIEAKSDKTTPIKLDVCEKHHAEFKQIMRLYTKQEFVAAPEPKPTVESRDIIKEMVIQKSKDDDKS